ncbi:MAG: integration host factor subunit alpha [Deltaproteobacteria bacterium GWC2_42_11]|nr:MAG: integration host factor subunit alpha [Deltaproteobacteria bacterium GWC2_42_11]
MTKAEIVENIFEKVGFMKKDVGEVVDLVFETIKDALASGEQVKLSGFGTFTVKQKRPRRGRNPQTGGDITITARKVLSFKSSHIMRDNMNRK